MMLQSQISGAFYGFNSDMLFKLTNGTYWLQTAYKYWYYYAYMPQIEIFQEGSLYFLRLGGSNQSVQVRQISGVIESQIDDAFEGWQGESKYKLTNGQSWKQERYKYEYKYSYRPHVIIYETSSGTVMDVDGCTAIVKRVS
jgi:hypothetical protein